MDALSIQGLRSEIDRRKKRQQPSNKYQFELGLRLLHSKHRHDVVEAIRLFEDLKNRDGPRRDYLYFIAQGYFAIGMYKDARNTVEELLRQEPTNKQAQQLLETIKSEENKAGVEGLLQLGAVAVLGVAAGVALFKGLRR